MRLYSTLLLSVLTISLWAQEADSVYNALLPILKEEGQNSRMLPTQEERNEAAQKFIDALDEICSYPEAMNFTFDGVSNMSILQSPDEHLRLFTFMVPQRNLTYAHHGYLIYDGGEEYKHIELIDNAMGGRALTFRLLPPTQWFGGLYYDIIEQEKDDQTVYFLLGYRSESAQLQMKFIDAVTFTDGLVRFGSKSFKVGTFNDFENSMPPYRLMMYYSAEYGAMMQWDSNFKGIIMDHVAPPDAAQKGLYISYGPDFTYDGLRWEDENWHLEEGIQFENEMETLPPDSNVPTDLGPRRQ
ncbi:hypothetical protein [Phaeocystidibacter luteus]|uniref:Uncharacterized protein n=1 Tax=Phaeocystidibacter luteus TaxID=911197 RepID=A0A6N6RKG0_9FLAO|nr:hypothetical protein [Phaeocystidibacter luteus]KAB2806792.1 hypothetical protein F8C67_13060 [Phaeocystidibacter luteus]